MLTLFLEGGFPMWFLLLFGALTLVCAARFAVLPEPARLRLAWALGVATLFTTFTAVSADVSAVGHGVPDYMAHHPTLSLSTVLLQGGAEAMSPAILGFTMLALSAVVVALGIHREPRA